MRGMRSRAPFLTWALLACLHFGLSQIAGAQDPNSGETTAAKSTVKNARQDGAATEKAQRDARGPAWSCGSFAGPLCEEWLPTRTGVPRGAPQ